MTLSVTWWSEQFECSIRFLFVIFISTLFLCIASIIQWFFFFQIQFFDLLVNCHSQLQIAGQFKDDYYATVWLNSSIWWQIVGSEGWLMFWRLHKLLRPNDSVTTIGKSIGRLIWRITTIAAVTVRSGILNKRIGKLASSSTTIVLMMRL